MGTTRKSASTKKVTRRRDGDPVKVYKDGRVAYYPSGRAGEGDRLFRRPRNGQTAEELAAELRRQIGSRSIEKGDRTLTELSFDYFRAHRSQKPNPDADREEAATGVLSNKRLDSTRATYRGRINNHVLPLVGNVRCRDVDRSVFTEVIDTAIAGGYSAATVRSIATALEAVVTWGLHRSYFGSEPPFGPPGTPKKEVERALDAVHDQLMYAETTAAYSVKTVPTHAQVRCLAEDLGRFRGGYHHTIVLKASGLRVAEFVALRTEDIDLESMTIQLRRQGRRDRRWNPNDPDGGGDAWTKRLKGRRARIVHVWAIARESLEWLVDNAVDGWLVPPDNGQTWWLDAFNRRINRAMERAGWPDGQRCHWLRHYYATYCLASAPDGYGFAIEDVSRWLGHSDISTTDRMYRHQIQTATTRHVDISSRPLGAEQP